MDKYIGFDIDSKKTDIGQMKDFLQRRRRPGDKLNLTFEVSGQSGYLYDSLLNSVDGITVSNPSKMTWIYNSQKERQD